MELDFLKYLGALGPLQFLGILGFLTYLLAFAAVQSGVMDGNGLGFTLSNMLAAALVGVSLLVEFNLSSALIQISYLVIGFIGIFRWALRRTARPAQNIGEHAS